MKTVKRHSQPHHFEWCVFDEVGILRSSREVGVISDFVTWERCHDERFATWGKLVAGFLKNDAAKVTYQLILVWGVNFSTETIVIGKVVEIRLVFESLKTSGYVRVPSLEWTVFTGKSISVLAWTLQAMRSTAKHALIRGSLVKRLILNKMNAKASHSIQV